MKFYCPACDHCNTAFLVSIEYQEMELPDAV